MAQLAQHFSRSAEWQTPPEIVHPMHLVIGKPDLDPASTPEANRRIQAKQIFTKSDNGLDHPWAGRVFVNPPGDLGGRLVKRFWAKLIDGYVNGEITEAIWLGFSLEQLVSLQNRVAERSPLHFPVCIPRKRIMFIDEQGVQRKAPSHGNFLAYLGARESVFYDVMSEHVGTVR